jgi:hypothetical protein
MKNYLTVVVASSFILGNQPGFSEDVEEAYCSCIKNANMAIGTCQFADIRTFGSWADESGDEIGQVLTCADLNKHQWEYGINTNVGSCEIYLTPPAGNRKNIANESTEVQPCLKLLDNIATSVNASRY